MTLKNLKLQKQIDFTKVDKNNLRTLCPHCSHLNTHNTLILLFEHPKVICSFCKELYQFTLPTIEVLDE